MDAKLFRSGRRHGLIQGHQVSDMSHREQEVKEENIQQRSVSGNNFVEVPTPDRMASPHHTKTKKATYLGGLCCMKEKIQTTLQRKHWSNQWLR